jgi:toxin ParE1/3/4
VAQIVWTEPALSDLEEIAHYIAIDNLDAARALVRQIFSRIERLEAHPKSGRIPPELKNSRYKEVIVGPCRIFYRAIEERVYVLYIMRSERQLRNYILQERITDKF